MENSEAYKQGFRDGELGWREPLRQNPGGDSLLAKIIRRQEQERARGYQDGLEARDKLKGGL